MMTGITEYLMNKDSSLRLEDEATDNRYSCFNTGGVEIEVGEFLYGLVRMMKPSNVFETGTHLGISSSYIAQAMKQNGKGLLTTVEINKDNIAKSKRRWKRIGVSERIVVDREPSLEYTLEYNCELMFLDSEPEYRFRELMRFFPRLTTGGYVFIHDLHRHMSQEENEEHFFGWPFGEIPKQVKELVGAGYLRPFHLPTPRGLAGFYKIKIEDYNW